ncbi:MAG: 1,4-alpha-glucan branching protein GlgB [Ignavibacteria bacterium]
MKKKSTGKKKSEPKINSSTLLSDLDIHLLGEGKHYKSYSKLGAQVKSVKKKKGVYFTVWAPNAKGVSVVGEFNEWKAGENKMSMISHSGYWSLFIPGMQDGDLYKFAIKSKSGFVVLKSDPYAFRAELRPDTASIVQSLKNYKWNDKDWITQRKKSSAAKPKYRSQPVSIYEVHLGSWKKDFDNKADPNLWGYKNYKDLAHEIVDYAKENNYTHIELLPIMEHPLDISWGYQVINYFAPTSRYGSPEDFMYFIDHCHQNEIGVILDWVPSHFPTDAHGLGDFDGEQIYAYQNTNKGFHKEWGTHVFDYGRNEVRNFLISNALFWFEKYHIDGLRVDAVASMLYLDYSRNDGEWEPNIYGGNENLEAISFLKKLNETVHKNCKGIMMIAEESSSWPGVTRPVHIGGLGFDMKWNMGWMHDILAYFSMDPVFRKFHHGKLTFAIWYAFNENFLLPISHDEVVHLKRSLVEKMPGDEWQKFANLRLLFGFMFSHPGKKLNFMGNDIAQYSEWNSESSLEWEVLNYDFNNKLHLYFREINRLYKQYSAFYEEDFESKGFQWLDFSDSDKSVIGFVRYNSDKSEMLMFTFNMTPVLREDYVFGVPIKGFYKEILNSNAVEYGGSGVGNFGGVHSVNERRFEFENSIKVTLPPLAVNVYLWERAEKEIDEPIIEPEKEEAKIKEEVAEEVKEIIAEEKQLLESLVIDEEKIEKENIDKEIDNKKNNSIEERSDTVSFGNLEGQNLFKSPVIDKDKTGKESSADEKKKNISDDDEMAKKMKEILNKIKKF